MTKVGSIGLASIALALHLFGCSESEVPEPSAPGSIGERSTASSDATGLGSPSEEGTLAAILADPNVDRRHARLSSWLVDIRKGEASDDYLPAIRSTVERFNAGETVAEFGLLFRFWADHDPANAADWALAPGKARFKLSAVFTAFEAWGRNDPDQAVLGVRRAAIEEDDISRTAQMAFIHGWFERDRDQLLDYIRDQGIGVERQRAIFGYALSLASSDGLEAAQTWAEGLPASDERFKLAAFRQTMNALTTIDLATAVSWCDEHCDSRWGSSLRKPIMRARLRAGDEPVRVLEWISRMSRDTPESEEERMLSLQLAYATWANSDRRGAVVWLQSVLDDPREPEWAPLLYRYYASLLASETPREAIAFVEARIDDPTDRERALVAVGQMWKTHDPDGAAQWLETSPLSEDARKRVLRFRSPG